MYTTSSCFYASLGGFMKIELYRTDGVGGLTRLEEEAGALGATSVRVDITATALNFRDLPFIRGNKNRKPAQQKIPLSDGFGLVSAIGSDVTKVKVGDRVSPTILPHWIDGPLDASRFRGSLGSNGQDGVLARSILVDQDALVKIPDYLCNIEAATLPTAALTAWHALGETGTVEPGDTIVIATTGGVATFALQIAVALGLKVIVTSRSDMKLARVRELGAWQTINSEKYPAWDKEVHALTDGQGAKLIVDMGLRGGLARSCRAAAYEGTVAIVGVLDGWETNFDIAPVMNKNLRVRGIETGSRAMFARMIEFFTQNNLHPIIASVFKFGEVDQALEALAAGPLGKIVLDISS
jgi:NADPH:quinone reductase-like Zn-dependent oxidoreductase